MLLPFNRLNLALFFLVSCSFAATYHVFPDQAAAEKNALGKGTATTSLSEIVGKLQPDDTVFMRGGHHTYVKTIRFNRSGTAEKRIHVMNFPGDEPVELDFTGNDGPGMVLDASYVDYVGQTFRGASDNGLLIEGNNNRIIRCTFLENGDSGLQIEGANNTVTNCDSYYNRDSDENDADGFAPKLDVGSGNKFIGCRAWQNSDDGWDGYLKSNKDVSQSLENCWAFKNGYLKNGSVSQGNGNGFKPGSADGTQNWTMKNCLAYGNLSKGFDQNHNLGSMTIYNCTSVNNGKYNFTEYEQPASGKTATIKNCLAVQTTASFAAQNNVGSFVVQSNNSWSGGFSLSAADFESIDPGSELSGPRKSDGSLPDIRFMHLKQGSDLIDAGTNVGIAFQGKAPDIGAFESSYTTAAKRETTARTPGIRMSLAADNGTVRIDYSLPAEGMVKITLFAISGKKLFETAGTRKSRGPQVDRIGTGPLTKGIYLCSLDLDGSITTRTIAVR
ncbi:MAG: right-handed parallel beta-helix repeat-containing protein [Chitinispirillaceae bacterium]|nr:right-handed parallel beta-helix repeat-containing protein [Chitinispirillaceae bacterium]